MLTYFDAEKEGTHETNNHVRLCEAGGREIVLYVSLSLLLFLLFSPHFLSAPFLFLSLFHFLSLSLVLPLSILLATTF